MKNIVVIAILGVAALGLSACDFSTHVSERDQTRLAAACTYKTGAGQPACDCIAGLARDELSRTQFRHLLAFYEDTASHADDRSFTLGEVHASAFHRDALSRCTAPLSGTTTK